MARKLCIQYPGAIYHAMNRGDHQEVIFCGDDDRELFLRALGCARGWRAILSGHGGTAAGEAGSGIRARATGLVRRLGGVSGGDARIHRAAAREVGLRDGTWRVRGSQGGAAGYMTLPLTPFWPPGLICASHSLHPTHRRVYCCLVKQPFINVEERIEQDCRAPHPNAQPLQERHESAIPGGGVTPLARSPLGPQRCLPL